MEYKMDRAWVVMGRRDVHTEFVVKPEGRRQFGILVPRFANSI
jgi:hypothetical protein